MLNSQTEDNESHGQENISYNLHYWVVNPVDIHQDHQQSSNQEEGGQIERCFVICDRSENDSIFSN